MATRIMDLTNAVFWAESGTDPLARAARTIAATIGPIALPFLLRRRRVLAAGMRTLGQLRVHYRHSPLSHNSQRRHQHLPRAGDRLRDATISTPGGRTRLHALTAQPGIHLLLQREAVAPDVGAIAPTVHVHRLTDAPGTGLVAIRPDGYVGFSGDCADADELTDWLELLCTSPPRAAPRTTTS